MSLVTQREISILVVSNSCEISHFFYQLCESLKSKPSKLSKPPKLSKPSKLSKPPKLSKPSNRSNHFIISK